MLFHLSSSCMLRYIFALLSFLSAVVVVTLVTYEEPTGSMHLSKSKRSHPNALFAHIFPSFLSREYFVVLGIAAVVEKHRQHRRLLQRRTCWSYTAVARNSNDFTGDMLVLYVFGRPSTPIQRAELEEEVMEWHDAVIVGVEEDVLPYFHNFKAMYTEVKMSRKTFLWYDMALRLFPRTSYIAKGDEDMFLRVPQYLADLRSLPRSGLYWGKKRIEIHRFEPKAIFPFMVGSLFTASRDVAQCVVSYTPLRTLALTDYTKERLGDYKLLFMDHEDVMFGQVLTIKSYPVVFLNDNRFHNFYPHPVPSTSVLIHYLKLEDYEAFKLRFSEYNVSRTRFREVARVKEFKGKIMLSPVE